MVCFILGPDPQAELVVMDETGVKGPILALPADKNALSCFLLSHFQVWEIKTRRQQARNNRWFLFCLFFKKKLKKQNPQPCCGRKAGARGCDTARRAASWQHGHTPPLTSELPLKRKLRKIHWLKLGNSTGMWRKEKRQSLLTGPFQQSAVETAHSRRSQAGGSVPINTLHPPHEQQ